MYKFRQENIQPSDLKYDAKFVIKALDLQLRDSEVVFKIQIKKKPLKGLQYLHLFGKPALINSKRCMRKFKNY